MSNHQPVLFSDFAQAYRQAETQEVNTIIITLQLLQPYGAKTHSGIARLLAAMSVARIGDNAFLVRTSLETGDIIKQISPHLLRGEFVCAFTATEPSEYYVPEFIGQQIADVLEGESESSESIPPAS